MNNRYRTLAATSALALLLAACAGAPQQGIQPKLASESQCKVSGNPAQCKLAHDLAGGYPFALDNAR
ncbi:MAG: hypothetical protein ACF8R7_17005 [Phycisphaerales bacterium JB039]